jgi:hypothetical protein
VEGSEPVVPSIEDGQTRRAAERVVPVHPEPPRRRRRSALLGGGLLVAASPVVVGAGVFVPGFAALGLGAFLLLLPPRKSGGERTHRSPWRIVGRPAAVVGRGTRALARGGARAGVRSLGAVKHVAATSGRDGAVRAGRASVDGAAATGRVAHAAGSRTWSGLLVVAPVVRDSLVVGARTLARDARSVSSRVWGRALPLLRRAWAFATAATARAARELAAFVRSASARLSAYLGSRAGRRSPPP